IGHFGKQFTPTSHANSLVRRYLWWSRWDSNPRPLRCESDYRQNAKYLPFRKLQPPREINGFPVLSHSLPSRIRRVLFFLATYWPLGIGVNPASVETTLLEVKMNSHSCEHWRSNGDNWSSASLVANPGEILRGSEDPHVTQYSSRNFAIAREETRQRQNILIVLKLISHAASLQADC